MHKKCTVWPEKKELEQPKVPASSGSFPFGGGATEEQCSGPVLDFGAEKGKSTCSLDLGDSGPKPESNGNANGNGNKVEEAVDHRISSTEGM